MRARGIFTGVISKIVGIVILVAILSVGYKLEAASATTTYTTSGTFTVNSVPIPDAYIKFTGQGSFSTRTDQNGNYSVSGVPSGDYYTDVVYGSVSSPLVPRELSASSRNQSLSVNDSDVIYNIVFNANVQQKVSIVDTNGSPVGGSSVTMSLITTPYNASSDQFNITRLFDRGVTSSDGSTNLPIYAGTNYSACAMTFDGQQVCQNIASANGAQTVTIVVPASRPLAVTVSGILTVNSIPIPKASIRFTGQGNFSTTTDQNGHYAVSGIPINSQYYMDVNYESPSQLLGVPDALAASSNSPLYVDSSGNDVMNNINFVTNSQKQVNTIDTNGVIVGGSHVTLSKIGTVFNTPDGLYHITNLIDKGITNSSGNTNLPIYAGQNYQVCAMSTVDQSQTCEDISSTGGTQEITVTVQTGMPLAAPTNLTISNPTKTPNLTWNASPGATLYNIYANNIKIGSSTTNSYVDNNPTPGNRAYYVIAVRNEMESDKSNVVNVAVVGTPVVTPSPTPTPKPIPTTNPVSTILNAICAVIVTIVKLVLNILQKLKLSFW